MSKILGIISEYNPFHNGHLYHLNESKKIVDPDYTIAIMSGNFVQRGNTAIIDKWGRAEMALRAGVDLVIELPTLYSISSAENFATGCIKILNSLKMDTTLSFGSECGDMSILQKCADILLDEPPEYVSILKHELDKGLSFPKARENALMMYLNDIRKYANVLSGSNNILGIEYLKAMKETKSKISAVTVKRVGTDYNSVETLNEFASATAIREMLMKNADVSKLLPKASYNVLLNRLKYGQVVTDVSKFEKEILFKLRTMTLEEISELQDVSEGLENKIKEAANSCNNLEDLILMIKSKRYTQTRINRILLYALLDITKEDIQEAFKTTSYIRVLGSNDHGRRLLSELVKKNKRLPVVTSVKRFEDRNNNKVLKMMLEKDILATNIYTLGYESNSKANLDYTKKMIAL